VPINGMRLRMWRKNRGLSQQKLAELSMVSRSYIAELEKGTKRPRPLVADALAGALSVTVDELIS
jgi:transcriptional regulator with XRE-family HTH domain